MEGTNLIGILKKIGLTENESRVYFASLSLGPSSILKIAHSAGIKRSTVYSIAASLQQQGLMHTKVRGFKKLFVASHPEYLEQILEKRKEIFQKHLPQFLAAYNLEGERNSVKCYEGLTAVKSLYDDSLKHIKSREDYLVITNQAQWLQLDEPYFLSYIKKRAKLPITTRLLFQDSPVARQHKRWEKNFQEQVKILPLGTSLEIDMVLTPQMLIIHQLIPPIMAIVIENKSVIKLQKELFEIIWKSLP
ncbi:MAG TPA: helix-turn-helix domain-containing protein [Patescibacteria group bacterium]|nr:helix-turn-helix domain-containing protein [Patescibacteria group bacterium]